MVTQVFLAVKWTHFQSPCLYQTGPKGLARCRDVPEGHQPKKSGSSPSRVKSGPNCSHRPSPPSPGTGTERLLAFQDTGPSPLPLPTFSKARALYLQYTQPPLA